MSRSEEKASHPARAGDSDEETYPAFQCTAAELAARIPFLLERIKQYRSARAVP